MSEIHHLKSSMERIHDIAETLQEEPDLPVRAKQAFAEIVAIARHKPDAITELTADGDGPFALGGGSIMDGKDVLT